MDLRYPIGRFKVEGEITPAMREEWISVIAGMPAQVRTAVSGLSDAQLDTPYRPEGWTVRQVVHHLADSHLNSYIRFRLALTEETPTIKPYAEALWAELNDARTAPIELSLTLLDSLHARWVLLLRSMTPEEYARQFRHPESGAASLSRALGIYAWHSRHHLAHITGLRERMGW